MVWIWLIIAGLFETFWATAMKLSQGFSKPVWAVLTILGMVASFAGLVIATKRLPIGVAYPVWTGIGAVGSVIMSVILFHDHLNSLTWIFVALLIISIIGIKATSGH